MKILFKDDDKIFCIEEDVLDWRYIINHKAIDLSNVPHLDDVEVLYHYKTNGGSLLPVYYEYRGNFLTREYYYGEYICYAKWSWFIKDYTLVNLNLI